ncbi:dynein axonemal assembly factor 1 homolog [Diorhabda carinulata]|uniref:dynein axonemal assembly factor 1 homolog n=1 Tax=Diorhabda carinulata TaxID=1163345 RepID=UPI0025A295EE|nr:dynein axonemal assembly factor 1 homolog [Diorhabda carinulata]
MPIIAERASQNEEKLPKKEYYSGNPALDELCKGPRMTKEYLRKHCKEQRLYQTPHLNDVLYLHFKGFSYIENLEEYTGLKCLWLENNGIREISGLDNQKQLRSLFLHYNLIKKIENLECCPILDTLNISYNQVKKIENLDCIKPLHTLNMSHNYVEKLEDFEHLTQLHELSVLDLSNNHVDDPLIVEVVGKMAGLRVLNLMGNPVIRKIPAYRKTLIIACKQLQYLDDRPVFPRDRACAEAWERGGVTEESAERQRWIDRERQKMMESVNAIMRIRERHLEERRQQCDSGQGTSVGDSESDTESLVLINDNVALENVSSSSSSSSDDNFMEDNQIADTREYEEYRERIFDFSTKTFKSRFLVEEITGEEQLPTTSAVNESIDSGDVVNRNEEEEMPKNDEDTDEIQAEIEDIDVEDTIERNRRKAKEAAIELVKKTRSTTRSMTFEEFLESRKDPKRIFDENNTPEDPPNEDITTGNDNSDFGLFLDIKEEAGDSDDTDTEENEDIKESRYKNEESDVPGRLNVTENDVDRTKTTYIEDGGRRRNVEARKLSEIEENEDTKVDREETKEETDNFDDVVTKEHQNEESDDLRRFNIAKNDVDHTVPMDIEDVGRRRNFKAKTSAENEENGNEKEDGDDREEIEEGIINCDELDTEEEPNEDGDDTEMSDIEDAGRRRHLEETKRSVIEENEDTEDGGYKNEEIKERTVNLDDLDDEEKRIEDGDATEMSDIEDAGRRRHLEETKRSVIEENEDTEDGGYKNEEIKERTVNLDDLDDEEKRIEDGDATEMSDIEDAGRRRHLEETKRSVIEENEDTEDGGYKNEEIKERTVNLDDLDDEEKRIEDGDATERSDIEDAGRRRHFEETKRSVIEENEDTEDGGYKNEEIEERTVNLDDLDDEEKRNEDGDATEGSDIEDAGRRRNFEETKRSVIEEYEDKERRRNVVGRISSADTVAEEKPIIEMEETKIIADNYEDESPEIVGEENECDDYYKRQKSLMKIKKSIEESRNKKSSIEDDDEEEDEYEDALEDLDVYVEIDRVENDVSIQMNVGEANTEDGERLGYETDTCVKDKRSSEHMIFYENLDKSDKISIENDGVDYEECRIRTRDEIKKIFSYKPEDENVDDVRYKEMLEWDIKLPPQNVQILPPINKKKDDEEREETLRLLMETNKTRRNATEKEYEITPPGDIIEDGDVILYPTSKIQKEDDKSIVIEKKLIISENFPIYQTIEGHTVDISSSKNEELAEISNSLQISNSISEIRQQMSDFTTKFDEFKEKYRSQREEIIRDYNEAVKRELEVVDKLMMAKETFLTKRDDARPLTYADLKKHYEDMGMTYEDEEMASLDEDGAKESEDLFEDCELSDGNVHELKKSDEKVVLGGEKIEILDTYTVENQLELEKSGGLNGKNENSDPVERKTGCSLEMQLAKEED